jgi:hypothetical protein
VSVSHIEFLVEEPSMEALLRRLLPTMLSGISFEVYPWQCKAELLARLPERLRGYSSWIPDSWRIVVIVDRDDDDCRELKSKLGTLAARSGFTPARETTSAGRVVANRLAIEELEAWFFGDWQAVRVAYPRVSATIAEQAKYREPDSVRGGTWEAFERILQKSGYFKTGLRKIEAARAIAEHMDPSRNRSPSFSALRLVLNKMIAPG